MSNYSKPPLAIRIIDRGFSLDLLIVATRAISNRRYIWGVCFKHWELKTHVSEETITLSDLNGKSLDISFKNAELASLWNKFITFPYGDQTKAGYLEDVRSRLERQSFQYNISFIGHHSTFLFLSIRGYYFTYPEHQNSNIVMRSLTSSSLADNC